MNENCLSCIISPGVEFLDSIYIITAKIVNKIECLRDRTILDEPHKTSSKSEIYFQHFHP